MRKYHLFVKELTLFFLLTGVLACGSTSVPLNSQLPIIDARCLPEQTSNCGAIAHERTLRVGLLAGDTGADCGQMITFASSEFFSAFRASGSTDSEFTGLVLRGAIESWVDGEGDEIAELPAGLYTACAYVDIDGNGLLGTNEPISRQVIDIRQINQLLDSWSEF